MLFATTRITLVACSTFPCGTWSSMPSDPSQAASPTCTTESLKSKAIARMSPYWETSWKTTTSIASPTRLRILDWTKTPSPLSCSTMASRSYTQEKSSTIQVAPHLPIERQHGPPITIPPPSTTSLLKRSTPCEHV